MKKNKIIILGCLQKGQIIFCAVSLFVVMLLSIVLDVNTAKEIFGSESIDYTIVVDAGHGGVDPGSLGYKTKVKESEINLSVAKLLEEQLKNIGFRVVMTRTTSAGLYGLSTTNYKKRDMQKRKEIINESRPDMVISIHMNSYTNHSLRGAQVFYDKDSLVSEQLASSIQNQFLNRLEKSNKGTAIGDYFMLKCTDAPSVIAECGFLSNAIDETLLTSADYQKIISDCIFVGIINFLNLT